MAGVIRVAPINHRSQLADLTKYELAVEIGTHRGVFAEELCRVRGGGKLICVDPWLPYDGDHALDGGAKNREEDMAEARGLLRSYIRNNTCQIFRATSLEFAVWANALYDLVYIDGDHKYEAVAADLRAWWPKVRPGGLLAGHDFICPGEEVPWPGVQKAVLQFSDTLGLDVHIVPENAPETAGQPWSFYIQRSL